MKTYLLSLPLLAFTAASLSLAAQTTPHAPVHHTATAEHRTEGGCVKVPEISPKIPTVPTGSPCARALFTFTSTPGIRLDYVSPLVSPEIRDSLGLNPTTFSLDYIDTHIGTGPLALPHKWYSINYTLYLLDGTRVESSFDIHEPFTFPVGQHRVIPGWDLGTQGMHIGGKRRLFIPYELAYGDRGQQRIPPKSELIFDIELVSQSDTPPAPHPMPQSTPRPGQPSTTAPAAKPNTPINTTTPNAAPPTPKP